MPEAYAFDLDAWLHVLLRCSFIRGTVEAFIRLQAIRFLDKHPGDKSLNADDAMGTRLDKCLAEYRLKLKQIHDRKISQYLETFKLPLDTLTILLLLARALRQSFMAAIVFRTRSSVRTSNVTLAHTTDQIYHQWEGNLWYLWSYP